MPILAIVLLNVWFGGLVELPVTVRCKGCGHILFKGREIVIVKHGRNSSYSILEVLIGTPCPVCGRILSKPNVNDIEIHAKAVISIRVGSDLLDEAKRVEFE